MVAPNDTLQHEITQSDNTKKFVTSVEQKS